MLIISILIMILYYQTGSNIVGRETQEKKIERLEKELAEKKAEIQRLYAESDKMMQKIYDLQDNLDDKIKESPLYKQMSRDNLILTERNKILERQVRRLEAAQADMIPKQHNARGAGRHTKAYDDFVKLMSAGKNRDEIIAETGISKMTYYRYRKTYDDDSKINYDI